MAPQQNGMCLLKQPTSVSIAFISAVMAMVAGQDGYTAHMWFTSSFSDRQVDSI